MSKKNRGLKNRTAFENAVDTKLYTPFKKYSEDTRVPLSKLLDEAIEDFLKKHSIPYEKNNK